MEKMADKIDKIGKKRFFNSSMFALILMVILVGMGEKMGERFLPLYLIALGGTTYAVSFLNGMDNLVSALYSFPGGYLSDKLGYKKALIIFNLIAMFGYSIVIIIQTWWAVLVGALFFIAWTAISLPAVMSMVSQIAAKNQRTMGVSMHSFFRRIPMALGPIVGGILISSFGMVNGIRIAFSLALVLGVVATLLEIFLIEEPPSKEKPASLKDSLKNIGPDLRNLLISDILIRFAEQIPYAFMAIWVVTDLQFTVFEFGILSFIEMITAMLIYIPVAYFADKSSKKPFVLATFVFFTIFPGALFFSRSFPLLILAFIIRGFKEFGEPTRKALIMDLAPENAKAGTFGVYYLIRDVVVSIAAFTSAFFWNISPGFNFLVATLFGVAGTIYFAVFGKDLSNLKSEKDSI